MVLPKRSASVVNYWLENGGSALAHYRPTWEMAWHFNKWRFRQGDFGLDGELPEQIEKAPEWYNGGPLAAYDPELLEAVRQQDARARSEEAAAAAAAAAQQPPQQESPQQLQQ